MAIFQHFILTRFNYGLYSNRRKDKCMRRVDNDEWMEHRFQLFEKYCLPSIKAQTNQNFKWLVLFDKKTPLTYLKKIKFYQTYSNFIPIFSSGCFVKGKHVEGYDTFVRYLKKHIQKDTEYLITTRLDNDDALNINAINVIQKLFNCQKRACLLFKKGFFMTNKNLYLINTFNNPFFTMFEKVWYSNSEMRFITVMYSNHRFMNRHAPVINYEIEPMWIQVVHERNLHNRKKGKLVSKSLLQPNFKLKFPVK